jgi:chorismate mutase
MADQSDENVGVNEVLKGYRSRVSDIDDAILGLLIERFKLTDEIGLFKKNRGISIENREVERAILLRLMDKADGSLDKETVLRIYTEIFMNSKERQKRL